MTMDDERVREYVAGLPDVSGTFTGTYSSDVDLTALLGPVPDLMPIEIDTGDLPNPAAVPELIDGLSWGAVPDLTVRIGERTWTLPVDHVDQLGGNRVRVWVRRQPHGAE
jgi:hypothetical protein